jgi:hypothetical protein
MSAIPEDLRKVHQQYEELRQAKGSEFAQGFLTYMVEVDYHKGDPAHVLISLLWTWHSGKFGHDIDDLLTHRVESDLVNGFEFAREYSQQMQYTYQDG